MNQFVLLGTTTDVPTGTRSSCYRGPKPDETSWHSTTCRGRNFTNLESFGFLLTRSRVFRPVGKRAFVNSHQRARTRHRRSKGGSRPWNWTAAELGADRASQWFSAPRELLQSAELGARRTLSVVRFGRADSHRLRPACATISRSRPLDAEYGLAWGMAACSRSETFMTTEELHERPHAG
ncbi:hypothetical protein V1272_001067 [Bradyrhizobium sp. AZCC 1708]